MSFCLRSDITKESFPLVAINMMSVNQVIFIDRPTHNRALVLGADGTCFHMVLLCSVLSRQERPGVLFYSPIAQSSRYLAHFFPIAHGHVFCLDNPTCKLF